MPDSNLFSLERFKIEDMCHHAAVCMIAKRASGKSFIVRDLVQKLKIPTVMVISPTDKLSGFYDDFVPSSFIHYHYDSIKLTRLFQRQERMIEKNRERVKAGKAPLDIRVLLIMDDCMADKKIWARDKNIAELLQNGRHYAIDYFCVLQYSLGISPELRSNFDYVFLLGEDFLNNKRKLYEHYAGMFPSFDIFSQVFQHVTNDYGAMVLNNRVKSSNIRQKVFWYKADVPSKDQQNSLTCSPECLKYHESHFNSEWNKKKKPMDLNDFVSKRHGVRLDVNLKGGKDDRESDEE
jgi:hypothetical protein